MLEKFDTEKHLPILKKWVVDEDLLFQFSAHGFTFPLTERQFVIYEAAHPDRRFYMAYNSEKQPYAFGEIIPQDQVSVRIGRLLVGGKENRGKGLGGKLIGELLKQVRKKHLVTRVDLFVLESNLGAQKCYLKAGFKHMDSSPLFLSFKGEKLPVLKMSLEL